MKMLKKILAACTLAALLIACAPVVDTVDTADMIRVIPAEGEGRVTLRFNDGADSAAKSVMPSAPVPASCSWTTVPRFPM